MSNPQLAVYSVNTYGNVCYIESPHGTFMDLKADQGLWTIINPSDACISYYVSLTYRRYGKNNFLMSTPAAQKIPKAGMHHGEITVIEYEDNFLLVGDVKPYLMPCGGSKEDSDYQTPGSCAVRELKEELGIDVSLNLLKPIGRFETLWANVLVGDYESRSRTDVFYLRAPLGSLAHLIIRPLQSNQPTIFEAKEYPFHLDETEVVVFLPRGLVELALERVAGRKLSGTPHYEVLRRLCGLPPVSNWEGLLDFFQSQ